MCLEIPVTSATNFTEEFFLGTEFKPVWEIFGDNPGYKIKNGPMEVEFMLQACSIFYHFAQ